MPPPQPHFQPDLMERFAAQLERRARNFVRGFSVAGGLFGGAVGSLPLTPAGDIWPVPHVLGFTTLALGLAAGAFVGFAASKNRAATLRLQAQSMLCQLHVQRTTFALWLLLKDGHGDASPTTLSAETAPAATEPEPMPVHEPAFEPVPEREPFVSPPPASLVPAFLFPSIAAEPVAALASPVPAPLHEVFAAPQAMPPVEDSQPMPPPLTLVHAMPTLPVMPAEPPPLTAPFTTLAPLALPSVAPAPPLDTQPADAPPPPLSPPHFGG